jgi:hypothetical protein
LNYRPRAQIRSLIERLGGKKTHVATDRSDADDGRRVLPFRRPGAAPDGGYGWRRQPHAPPPPTAPTGSLAKYEGGDHRDDNYRHRMVVNIAALSFTVLLAIAGGWLAIQIAEMRRNQDCVLSGRRNCAPIDAKALQRW